MDDLIGIMLVGGAVSILALWMRRAGDSRTDSEAPTAELGNGVLTGAGGSLEAGAITPDAPQCGLPSPAPLNGTPSNAAVQCACHQIVYPWYTSPYCLGCGRLTASSRWLCPICRAVVGGDAKVQSILHVADSAKTPADLARASDLANAVLQDLRMFQEQAKYN